MEADALSKIELKMSKLKLDNDVEAFIKEYCDDSYREFYEFMRKVIHDKNLKVSDIIRRSGINQNYGYNIMSGARKNPGRDKVLAICLGSGLSFDETQEALDASGCARLYYKNERDVRITVAINNNTMDVMKLNIELSDKGLVPLSV